MPTARISSAVRANEPRLALKSGRAHTTIRAPSCGAGSAASKTARVQITRTETAAMGSRKVRKTGPRPPRAFSSAICPSTQMRPRRAIQPPTICRTVRTGAGDSGDVSSGMAVAVRRARGSAVSLGELRDSALVHRDDLRTAAV